jgi:hypothetical protein
MSGKDEEKQTLLMRGETLLGTLEYVGTDMPTYLCIFHPSPAYEPLRPIFDEEVRLMYAHTRNPSLRDLWIQALGRIQSLGLRLMLDDEEITNFVIHIDGNRASYLINAPAPPECS